MSAFDISYYLSQGLNNPKKVTKQVRLTGPTDEVSVILRLTIILLCVLVGVISLGPIALSYYYNNGGTAASTCGEKMSFEQAGNYTSEDQAIEPISC